MLTGGEFKLKNQMQQLLLNDLYTRLSVFTVSLTTWLTAHASATRSCKQALC